MAGTNGKIGFNEATTPDKYYGTYEVQENGAPVQLNKAVIVDSAGQEVDVAREGKDVTGASMPAGGIGIRGWLSAIFQKLSNTLSISGTVSVSNLPATQAVSAQSLPLPAGASTEATLALIKAKTDNIDVLLSSRTKPADVQKVDGSGITQPISAQFLPLPTGAATEQTLGAIKTATEKQSNSTIVGGKIDGQTVVSLEQLFKYMIAEQRITNHLLLNEFTHNNEDDIEQMRIEILGALNK